MRIMMAGMLCASGLMLAPAIQAADRSIEINGQSHRFSELWEDYQRCQARQSFTPARGEYESQDEYNARLAKFRAGCDPYKHYENAVIEVPVFLKYDPDEQRFSFTLPNAENYQIDYQPLVWDDFPGFLDELPRDRWHVDAPTPRASVYKACEIRSAEFDTSVFERVEPFHSGSWNGCMTYYNHDDLNWRRERDAFVIHDVSFYAYASIDRARELKAREKTLFYRLQGSVDVPEKRFRASRVELVDTATGKQLVVLE